LTKEDHPPPEEAALVERLVARDESAFNELCELYQARIFALSFRMLGRREEARDVTQEVFVQVFKAIEGFRGEARLSTWLFRIAVNLCKNRMKYRSRRADGERELPDGAESSEGLGAGSVERPDQLLEGIELERVVKVALECVDPEFRELVVLRDVEDLTLEEIAAVTGLKLGTIKSRIHRGRAQLRAEVERLTGEPIGQGRKR
jgi:RNA polymerase sigma-70 factor (ECF subfamily)